MPFHEGRAVEHVEAALLLLQLLESRLPLKCVGKKLELVAYAGMSEHACMVPGNR